MLRRVGCILTALCGVAAIQHANAVWEYANTAFSGGYFVYGGDLDTATVPSPGDTKIAFRLTGNAAKEMFGSLGPDDKDGCPGTGIRVRQKDMLLCRYRKQDGYRCNFGFDLSTGLSIGGVVSGSVCKL